MLNLIELLSNLQYNFHFPENLIVSKINQDRHHLSQTIEMRIIFLSCIGHMTWVYLN